MYHSGILKDPKKKKVNKTQALKKIVKKKYKKLSGGLRLLGTL